jgi:hypothetical protein
VRNAGWGGAAMEELPEEVRVMRDTIRRFVEEERT